MNLHINKFMKWISNKYDLLMPRKKLYPITEQSRIKKQLVNILKQEFNTNKNITEIILYGSLVNGTFGIYEKPTTNGRIASDIDILLIVNRNYKTNWKLMKRFFGATKYLAGIIKKKHWIQAFVFCPTKNKVDDTEYLFLPINKSYKGNVEVLFSRDGSK